MANANWKGGKAKGRNQSKAWLRHNDPEHREEVNHSNKHIDTSLTYLNEELGVCANMTYEQKSARLDAVLDDFGYKEVKGSNQRVSTQSVCFYPPDGLLEYDEEIGLWKDTPELRDWFKKTNEIWEDFVGADYCVGSFVDYDEQHWYRDPITKEWKFSKPHMHSMSVPIIDGRISGKAFSARTRMIELNERVEEMTQREFRVQWQSGEGKRPGGNKSVEQLKRESAAYEQAQEVIVGMEQALENLEEVEQLISDMHGNIYTGADGKQYAGLNAINKKRDEELARLSNATEKADKAKRRADSEVQRADSARRVAESNEALAKASEQRLTDTQSKENDAVQRLNGFLKTIDEWEHYATTIKDDLKTSNDIVKAWDAYSDVIHETGLYDKQSETDRAAFDAVQAARNNNPWVEMYENVLEMLRKLRQFKLRMQQMLAEREHADTGTLDAFGGNQHEDAGIEC